MNPLFLVVRESGQDGDKVEVVTRAQVESRGYRLNGPMDESAGPGIAGYYSIALPSKTAAATVIAWAVAFGRREHDALELLDLAGELVEAACDLFASAGEIEAAQLGHVDLVDHGGAGSSMSTRLVSRKRLKKLAAAGLAQLTDGGGYAITEKGRAAMAARRDPRGREPAKVGTQGELFASGSAA